MSGIRVIPIEKDPTESEIREAMAAADVYQKSFAEGMYGKAYFLGEDLVVKKYDYHANAKEEINALDNMFDKGILSKGLQSGVYAFQTPEGKYYLVSKKIKGEPIDRAELNQKNLPYLLDAFLELDKPKSDNEGAYGIYVYTDMRKGNILASKDSAGIVDFEFLPFIRFADMKALCGSNKHKSSISDIPEYISNLRNFESKILFRYVNDEFIWNDKKEELFYNYLTLKSEYHKKMSEYLEDEYEKSGNKEIKDLAVKHKAHARVLKEPVIEVEDAEYLKIKISSFLANHIGINRNFVQEAYCFMTEMAANAQTEEEKIYFEDCVEFIKKALSI